MCLVHDTSTMLICKGGCVPVGNGY